MLTFGTQGLIMAPMRDGDDQDDIDPGLEPDDEALGSSDAADLDEAGGGEIAPEVIHPLVALPDDDNLPALASPGLHRYLQEISQYQLLSREEA